MEVTLDAIDWSKLTSFEPLSKYFDEYLFEIEEYPDWILTGPDYGWTSDRGSWGGDLGDVVTYVAKLLTSPSKIGNVVSCHDAPA